MEASEEGTLGAPSSVACLKIVCAIGALHNTRPLPVSPHGVFPEDQPKVVDEAPQAPARPDAQVWELILC